MRHLTIRALVVLAASGVVLTELLGGPGWLRPFPLAVGWIFILGALSWRAREIPKPAMPQLDWTVFSIAAACMGILATVAITSILSPPNSADAMAYHLPRVVYWAQAGSVRFFPTPYFNQVMLAPAAEYLMLHTYLLTGGDRLVNLVACAAFAGCIVTVSAIAREWNLTPRSQAIAALLCATLPNGILQASGAKNDMLLSLWIAAAVYFALRREGMWLGLAAGLAVATKATAFLFLPPLLLALGIRRLRHLAWIAAGVLALNTPQFARNLTLTGSPLGYDSAQGDGRFRWRNEHLGWRPLVSNLLRNASEQFGARSERWNHSVYTAVLGAHRLIGLDPDDPATTWPGSRFSPPRNANHEANANNRWHLLLIVAAGLWAVLRRQRPWIAYSAGLAGAFLLFCWYLKWQPFLARLELPLFVAATPLAAWLAEQWRPRWIALAVCVLLLSGTRLALFENWTRPLKGPNNLWISRRDDDYFRDMGQWNNRSSYLEAVDRVARSGCGRVGIDISENQLEYPFQALLRERNPQARFAHTEADGHPCAVLCLDCIGNEQKIARYAQVGTRIEIGRFLLFLQ